jgi:hypothetical protein
MNLKKIISLALFSCFYANAFCELNTPLRRENFGLKGPVKIYVENSNDSIVFNEKGEATFARVYSKGSIRQCYDSKFEYEYDENDRVTKATIIAVTFGDTTTTTLEYDYDIPNNTVTIKGFSDNQVSTQTKTLNEGIVPQPIRFYIIIKTLDHLSSERKIDWRKDEKFKFKIRTDNHRKNFMIVEKKNDTIKIGDNIMVTFQNINGKQVEVAETKYGDNKDVYKVINNEVVEWVAIRKNSYVVGDVLRGTGEASITWKKDEFGNVIETTTKIYREGKEPTTSISRNKIEYYY